MNLDEVKNFIVDRVMEITQLLQGQYTITVVLRHRSGDDKKSLFVSGETQGQEQLAIHTMSHIIAKGKIVG